MTLHPDAVSHVATSPAEGTPAVEFGPFRLDVGARRLSQAGDVVPVSPRAFDILSILVRRAGTTVSKAELMQRVWPDVYVEEANIAQHVSQLRRLLGDTTKQPTYVATIPKEGYRFVAPVRLADSPALSAEAPHRVRGTQPLAFVVVAIGLIGAVLAALKLAAPVPQPASTSAEAQRAYQLGQFLLAQNTPEGSVLARNAFADAVRLDPGFGDAQADLALAYVSVYLARRAPRAEALDGARAAAAAALAVDERSSEAHTAQGAIFLQLLNDPSAAAREFARATALKPSNVMALDLLARALRHQGRFEESIRAAREALSLDATSVRAHMNLAQSLFFAGRSLDQALDLCRRALQLDRTSVPLLEQAADIADAAGRWDESIDLRARAERASDRPALADLVRTTHQERGYATAMVRYLEARLAALDRDHPADPAFAFERGRLLARLGRLDDAFAAFDAGAAGDFSLGVFALRYHPAFRALKADSRFSAFEARAVPR